MARSSYDSVSRSFDRLLKSFKPTAAMQATAAAGRGTKTILKAAATKPAKQVSPSSVSKPGKRTIKLGIERDPAFMYFIKDGAVWRVPRKRPGMPKGKKEKVRQFAEAGSMDYGSYLYFLDGAGNVVMNPRKNRR